MHQPESTPEAPRPPLTARVYRLGEEPGDDLSTISTAEQRLAMVAVLTRRMWELTGRPVPRYERTTMAVRLRRPS